MKISRIGLIAAFILGTAGSALAQSPLRFLSSSVKAGQPVPKECLAEAKVLESFLAQSPQRKGWINVLACDERAWQNALDAPGHMVDYQGNSAVDFTGHEKVFDAAQFRERRVKSNEPTMRVAAIKVSPAPVTAIASPVPSI